jgi:hypothetical protein
MDIESVGLIMAMDKRAGSSATRAETAAAAAEASAERAAQHSMGVSIDDHKIVFTMEEVST